MDNEGVWIIVPAFNEAPVIQGVIDPLCRDGYQVIVVDDGSADDTGENARRGGAHVCRHVVNLGQGAAVQTGITYALRQQARYLVTFDADGQHAPEDIPRLLEPLMSGEYDVALGTRFGPGSRSSVPWLRRTLLKAATWYTRLALGLRLTDTHNGLKAFTAEAAAKLKITQNRMAHATEILSQIRRHRMRYVEVPVCIRYTSYSVAKGQKSYEAFTIFCDSLMGLFRT